MADVKNMPETVTGSANSSLPLISAKTLKSAQLGSGSSTTGQRSHIIQAEVISSQKHPDKSGQSLVTVSVEGRQLQLSSEQSLSKGSQLTLQLLIQAADDNAPESIQKIQVVAINSTALQPTLPSGKPTNIEAALKQLAQQLQAHQPQTQQANTPGTSNTQGTSTNPLTAGKPSAGEIRQWLAQTLPLATLRPQTQTSALTTYSDSVRTYSASVKTHNAAPQASGTGSQLTNNPTINLQLAALAQKALNNPETPAVVKHTLNQYLTQLTSATQSAGAKQQIHNSGLNFEAKLVSLLTSIANQVNSSANQVNSNANPLNTETPSAATANVFKSLWQVASSSATTNSNQSDTAKGSNEGRSISQILANTKSQLENSLGKAVASLNGNSEATQLNSQTNSALSTLSEQLNQLQSSDLKAVLSKSLQLWLNQINAQRAGSGETQATQQLSSQLSTTLQERLPEGFRLLQGALANIESEQLQRLQQSNDQWQLSFPLLVRQDQQLNDVRAQLFKDTDDTADATGKQKKIQWRVHLHFDLEQLGPLDVEVNMRPPSLSATFWSTQASTLALLQQHLAPLRSKLSQFGVEVETLNARHGQLPERQRNQIHGNLVDIHS